MKKNGIFSSSTGSKVCSLLMLYACISLGKEAVEAPAFLGNKNCKHVSLALLLLSADFSVQLWNQYILKSVNCVSEDSIINSLNKEINYNLAN